MKQTKQHCSTPDQFLTFLRGQLSDREEADLQQHLNDCVSCRERLENTAADASVWHEARQFFGNGALHASTNDSSDEHEEANQGTLRIRQVLDDLGPTDDPESLGRIGGYEVTGVVGAGGMGVVLKAHDRSLDRIVAIKVMSPHLASSGSARKRFAREAKAAAAVLHPNVIAIHSVASEDANPYLVMPFVRGASLQKRIDSQGPLPLKDTLRISAQIAAGLAAAHEQGLVHRDIKPANILLEEGVERVMITDFGLARAVDDASMTCSGVIAGTPQYMSPEQARGEPIDARSDLFSLGSVLYAMCTGRSPFRAETTFGVLHRIASDKPTPVCEVNSDIPAWLGQVIEQLMAKRPKDRFESAAQVAELLEGCLAHVQQPSAIALPVGVQALAAQSQLRAGEIPRPNRLRASHQRIPPAAKLIAAAVCVVALLFGGMMIVLELKKGTLTIESEIDDVPICIVQGKDVVEELTVSKSGKSVRIAAGNYDVEIGGQFDGLSLDKRTVALSRGGNDVVRIVRTSGGTEQVSATPKIRAVSMEAPFQGRIRWGDGIHENAPVKHGDLIAELIEFDPKELSNRLSAAKQKLEAGQAFVRASDESLNSYRANVEAHESQLTAYEQAKGEKSQVEVVYATTALSRAKDKAAKAESELAKARLDLNESQKEVVELETKLARQKRHVIHSPFSGFVTNLCQNELLKEGDVICLLWPVNEQRSIVDRDLEDKVSLLDQFKNLPKGVVDSAQATTNSSKDARDTGIHNSAAAAEYPPVKIVIHDEEGRPREGVRVSLYQVVKDSGGQVLEINETSNASGMAVNRNLPYGHYALSATTSDGWYLSGYGSQLNVEFEKGLDVFLVAPTPNKTSKLVISSDITTSPEKLRGLRFGERQEGNMTQYAPEPNGSDFDREREFAAFPTIADGIEYIGAEIRLVMTRNISQPAPSLQHMNTRWIWNPLPNSKVNSRYLIANGHARGFDQEGSTGQDKSLKRLPVEGSEYFKLPSPKYRVGASLLKLREPTKLPLELDIPAGDVKVSIGSFLGKPSAAVMAALNWQPRAQQPELWLEARINPDSAWVERLINTEWLNSPLRGGGVAVFPALWREQALRPGERLEIPLGM